MECGTQCSGPMVAADAVYQYNINTTTWDSVVNAKAIGPSGSTVYKLSDNGGEWSLLP